MQLHSALCLAIDAALKEADITIPFPQRDIHVKTDSVLQVAAARAPSPAPVSEPTPRRDDPGE